MFGSTRFTRGPPEAPRRSPKAPRRPLEGPLKRPRSPPEGIQKATRRAPGGSQSQESVKKLQETSKKAPKHLFYCKTLARKPPPKCKSGVLLKDGWGNWYLAWYLA